MPARFRVPARMLPPAGGERVRATWLTRETSPCDAIRRDLTAAGLLAADFVRRPDRLGYVRQMADDRKDSALVVAQLPKYRQIWVDSLTLKPLDPALGTVIRDANGLTVTVHLAPPAVLVLDLR